MHQGVDVTMEPHSESGRGRGSQLREEGGPRRTGVLWGGVQAHWNSFYFLSRSSAEENRGHEENRNNLR